MLSVVRAWTNRAGWKRGRRWPWSSDGSIKLVHSCMLLVSLLCVLNCVKDSEFHDAGLASHCVLAMTWASILMSSGLVLIFAAREIDSPQSHNTDLRCSIATGSSIVPRCAWMSVLSFNTCCC